MPGTMDSSERHRLVQAFLRVEAMRKRRTRDIILDILCRDLGHTPGIARQDEDVYDVWQIVDACLLHPGAIHTLLDAIEPFQRGSTSLREARDLVTELLPDPLLLGRERRDVYGLAAVLERGGMSPDEHAMLPALYRQAVGPAGPPLDRMVAGVRDVLMHLEEVAALADGTPPLLLFVHRLAGRSRQPVADELRAWAARFAERLQLDPERPALRAGRTWSGEESAYLVVECRPDSTDPRCYFTSAWLQFGLEPGVALLREDRPRLFDELPELLETLLVKDPRVVNRHIAEMTIEFVLPRNLLGIPLDQVQYAYAGLSRRLGLDYPVVVRSLERMRSQQLHHSWRQKWTWFQEHPESGIVTWVGRPGEFGPERLYAILAENSKVCLVLAFPPREDGTEPIDEVGVGIQAGTPIVLWCREGTDPERFSTDIRELLASDLMSLPQKIRNLRIRAARSIGNEHPGNHLTLVFEDADRLPEPYLRLRAPR